MSTSAVCLIALGLGIAPVVLATEGNTLFVTVRTGQILEFIPGGPPQGTIFASGLKVTVGLAFDSSGNLYEADSTYPNFGGGTINKFAPDGTETVFASGLGDPLGLAVDANGNVYVGDAGPDDYSIYKFTPEGTKSTFASGVYPLGLLFDANGNLYEADAGYTEFPYVGRIYKFTPQGVKSTFASGLGYPFGLAFDGSGNLYASDSTFSAIFKFTPQGSQTTFASGLTDVAFLAFDSVGNLFATQQIGFIDEFTPEGVKTIFASGLNNPVGLAFANGCQGNSPCISVFPNQGPNSGPINVELTGSPLLSGAQVQLSAAGLPSIPGTNTFSASASVLAATFDLTGAMPGSRDVIITPVGGSAIDLSSAFAILPTPPCSYTVAPLSALFPTAGGEGSVVVTSNVNTSQCNFHTSDPFPSNVTWITPAPVPLLVIGGTGVGAEALLYQVAPNAAAGARSTTIPIYGQNVTISQAGTGTCAYSLNPGSAIFPQNGGPVTISVSTAAGCAWSASSPLAWLHVTAGSAGSGNGSVTIQADPNAGALRSGDITIAGKLFTVSQSASGCGATDVSSQVTVSRGPILSGFIGQDYQEVVTLRNQGPSNLTGPVYLVLDGLPVTSAARCGTFLGQAQTCVVTDASMLTYCQSPSGSDMVLFSIGLAAGQTTGSGTLYFTPGLAGGAEPPNWYTTRVFNGTPNQ